MKYELEEIDYSRQRRSLEDIDPGQCFTIPYDNNEAYLRAGGTYQMGKDEATHFQAVNLRFGNLVLLSKEKYPYVFVVEPVMPGKPFISGEFLGHFLENAKKLNSILAKTNNTTLNVDRNTLEEVYNLLLIAGRR